MPISLGSITFGIGADTTRLNQSISDIQRFGTAVAGVSGGVATSAAGIEGAFRRQEAAMISALQKVQRYQDAVARLQAPTALTQGLNQLSTRGLDQLIARMSSGQLSAIQFQREMERFNATMNNAQRIMKNYADAQKQAEASSMVASLQKLSSAAILVAGPLSGIATRISVVAGLAEHFSLAWAGMIAGIAAGAYTFYKLSTATIAVEKSLQSMSATMQAVYGNLTIANLQMSYLRDLSDRSGLSIAVLGKQFGQFQAAAKGTNLEGERSVKVFEAIVFAAQKLGLGAEETEGALKAIQEMMSKGVISSEELKGQLGDRLPGAVKVLADSLGVTTLKLAEMMKKGEVSSSALIKFSETLKTRYNIDTSQKIDTITAAEGRLSTARIVALDNLDKLIGFSNAYKNTLNFLTEVMNKVGNDTGSLVQKFLQVGAALTAAFLAPRVIDGMGALVFGIARITSGIWALNAATAAGAFTSFVKLLATATVAIAAYYGSEKLIGDMLDKNTKSYLSAKPAVEEYIDAQKKLVTSVRAPTLEYIKDQEKLLKTAEEQVESVRSQAVAYESWRTNLENMGLAAEQVEAQLKEMFPTLTETRIQKAISNVEKYKETLKSLNDILKRQTAEEEKARKDPEKELSQRQKSSIDKAEESIRNLKEKYNAVFDAPAQKEFKNTQEEINHAIETFKENLERAEIPAAKVKELVEQYGNAFRKLKEAELSLKNHVSGFQLLEQTVKKTADTFSSTYVDALVDGTDKMKALQDSARTVVKFIINEFMKLAVIAPLLNSLFGTNYQTLGGGGGIGGMIGSLFGGGGGTGGVDVSGNSFAGGGIMTSGGPVPLRRYAGGGVANSPQLAMYGEGSQNEAFVPLPDGRRIPVALSGAMNGGGGQIVNILPPAGHEAVQQKKTTSQGQPQLDVMFRKLARSVLMQDMNEGGPISRQMETQFGLNRARGLPG